MGGSMGGSTMGGSTMGGSTTGDGGASGDSGTVGGIKDCPMPRLFCDGRCVDVSGDRNHCGGCDTQCNRVEDCVAGGCICSGEPELLELSPANAAVGVRQTETVRARFSCPPERNDVGDATMHVYSAKAGYLPSTFPEPQDPRSVVLDPRAPSPARQGKPFFAGEVLTTWLGRDLGGPYSSEFWAAVRSGSSATFVNTGQELGSAREAELGDLDGDGDLDAVTWSSTDPVVHVWSNDGRGGFSEVTSLMSSERPKLGDFDADGRLDLVASTLFLGSGNFAFEDSGQAIGTPYQLADFDGDGDLDVFSTDSQDRWHLLRNDGSAHFDDSLIGEDGLHSSACGDLDNDGDLDLVLLPVETDNARAVVLFNEEGGLFTEDDAGLAVDATRDVTLGDLDGDGDLDLVMGSWGAAGARNPANQVWLNDGSGQFVAGDTPLSGSVAVTLGDLDGDGDLDLVAGQHDPYSPTPGEPSRVLLNDGGGKFTSVGEVGSGNFQRVRLGDLDGDGDLDALVAQWDWFESPPVEVWLQKG